MTATIESHGDSGFAPRIWMGCPAGAWLKLLQRNRFAVHASHLYFATVDSLIGPLNSALALWEKAVYGDRLHRFQFRDDPLFILGHWRTGTTLLQELLALDPRHVTPSTYQCFAPAHFLLTEPLFAKLLKPLLPRRRPMDGMPMSFQAPFEDEFALAILGVPSPYEAVAFPNLDLLRPERFDVGAPGSKKAKRWERAFFNFCRRVAFARPEARLILKSPPHTCRVAALLRIFPNARFLYLTRNPFDVFPSTVHLWRTLFTKQGLQRPSFDGLEERVFECFAHLHDSYERDRGLISNGRLMEVSFEALAADPLALLQRVYAELLEADFEPVRAALEARLAERRSHARNRYELVAADRDGVKRRWAPYFLRHGYPLNS